MKNLLYIIIALGFGILFNRCDDSDGERIETLNYKINEPVFMDAKVFRNSVKVSQTPKGITGQGKMCFYEGFIYISEPEKGIHIINNKDPQNPQNIAFIEIMGNADIAIRDNTLYADSYIDMIWFDISSPSDPQLKGRLENVFLGALPPVENEFGYDYTLCEPAKDRIVTGWNLVERSVTMLYNPEDNRNEYLDGSPPTSSDSKNGVNGSMSRFCVYKDYLYAVMNESHKMDIFDLSGNAPVVKSDSVSLSWNVETIFNYKEYLYLGTPRGMMIYSVSDPIRPEYQSSLQHVYGCDPVVVENDIAYVTIHSGNSCGQNTDELLVIDVSDVKEPKQIASYAMKNPKGLAVQNGILYLCDDGLKIYGAENPQEIIANKIAHFTGMDGYDVIPFDNMLMMIANDGLYQYDCTNIEDITQMSKLPIVK